jgi:hypothetical protein
MKLNHVTLQNVWGEKPHLLIGWGAVSVVEHFGHLKEEKNILPLPGFQLQFHGHLACWLVIILTLLSKFIMLHFFLWWHNGPTQT